MVIYGGRIVGTQLWEIKTSGSAKSVYNTIDSSGQIIAGNTIPCQGSGLYTIGCIGIRPIQVDGSEQVLCIRPPYKFIKNRPKYMLPSWRAVSELRAGDLVKLAEYVPRDTVEVHSIEDYVDMVTGKRDIRLDKFAVQNFFNIYHQTPNRVNANLELWQLQYAVPRIIQGPQILDPSIDIGGSTYAQVSIVRHQEGNETGYLHSTAVSLEGILLK